MVIYSCGWECIFMASREEFVKALNSILYNLSDEDVTFVRNNIDLLSKCNKDALRNFLNQMLIKEDINTSLKVLVKSGILFFIIPELKPLVDLEQPNKYHDYDAFGHTMEAVKYSENDLVLRLSMLLHDVGKPDTYNKDEEGKITFYGHPLKGERIAYKILNRLGYNKNLVNEVCMYVRHHMDYAPTEKSFNKMLKELGNDISKVDKLLKVKLYDSYASKGENSELADYARNIDGEYRKILSKYQR